MAKQGKALPARRQRDMESSLFLRSAESLGRVIGTLQRQLDSASKRLTDRVEDADDAPATTTDERPRKSTAKTSPARKTKRAAKSTRAASTARKTSAGAARKTKRAGAKKTTRRR